MSSIQYLKSPGAQAGAALQQVIKARHSLSAITCWYSGLLLRSCSFALAYAAEMQVAGRPSFLFFPFFFPFFGLEALKYPAEPSQNHQAVILENANECKGLWQMSINIATSDDGEDSDALLLFPRH